MLQGKKTAVITGAAGGIGKAVAERLAQMGFERLVLCYHKQMPTPIRQQGVEYILFQGDLSASETATRLAESVDAVSLLVNCAGVAAYGLVCQTTDDAYRRVMGSDLDSVFYLMRALNSHLLQSVGSVINIASVWGVCGASCESVYSAAKAGVIGFTKAWAKEYAPMGIRVNAIAPGVIDTPMLNNFTAEEKQAILDEIPLGRMGTGTDVADAVEFLVKCQYITGQTLVVDGGYIG